MNINDISTQLIFTTTPIVARSSEGTSQGTGFFFNYKMDESSAVPLLVTNFHVIDGATLLSFKLNIRDADMPSRETIDIQVNGPSQSFSKLGKLDLAVLPVAPVFEMLEREGKAPFYRSIDASLVPERSVIEGMTALETVTFIGYPSGVYDDFNKTPVIRQGTTATPIWNNYRNEPGFLIDASVYPGSSGSPVFIFNQGSYATSEGITLGSRLLFVGVLERTLKTDAADHADYIDLGYVRNVFSVMDELAQFVNNLIAAK